MQTASSEANWSRITEFSYTVGVGYSGRLPEKAYVYLAGHPAAWRSRELVPETK